jgi:uncharacterized protein (DUF362 family)
MHDPIKIFVAKNVTNDNKIDALEGILADSGFFGLLNSRLAGSNQQIVIKANIAPASQTNYHYYTDPALVNHLVGLLFQRGYENVKIVESETNFAKAIDCLTPDKQAEKIGYEYPVVNLTRTRTVKRVLHKMSIRLSETMLNAAFIINFAKAKNHDLMLLTGALKNMYGSIPNYNKYRLFHKRQSGYGVPEATFLVNHFTPPGFNIIDFIESVDGNEVSLFRNEVTNFKYFPSHRIVVGTNALAIDKYLSLKMGYGQEESPIINYYVKQTLNLFDVRSCELVGDTFRALPSWRKISRSHNIKARLQDMLPISDELISTGIRMYHFDVCDNDKKHGK